MLARLLFIWMFLLSSAAFASGEVMYIHTDGLGSPVARTNQQGQVISRTRYEPYGATAAGQTPTIGFTGHVNDPDTGLIYMQQRYYDPYAGRFLSTDPVLTDANTGGGFNRYIYANNNPFRYIDPDGRFSEDACKAMAGNCSSSGGSGSKNEGDSDSSRRGEYLRSGAGGGETGASREADYDTWARSMGYMNSDTYNSRAMARGVAIGGPIGVGGKLVVGATLERIALSKLSVAELKGIIGKDGTKALGELFGSGMKGAENALKELPKSTNLTRGAAEAYKELARKIIVDYQKTGNSAGIALQQARIDILNKVSGILK